MIQNHRQRLPGLHCERGTALVMALLILLILTVLGITAMNTSTLEERMAGNTQEATRAFEAAESGINAHLASPNLNLTDTTPVNYTFASGQSGKADVNTKFLGYSEPLRGSGFATSDTMANFEVIGTGTTMTGAKSAVHQGVQWRMATN